MSPPTRQSDREAALEKKKVLAQRLLNRSRLKQEAPLNHGVETKQTTDLTPLNPPLVPEEAERYGEAEIPVYREGETAASIASPGLVQLIDLYLDVAKNKTRRIVMIWPVAPTTLLLVHALATLERWKHGDKQGIRGLAFPAKSNVYQPLNHIHLDRSKLLSLAQQMVTFGGQVNPLVKRELQAKDPYLFSMGSLKPEREEQFNPTVGELLPHFYAGMGFQRWTSCAKHLLEHISARLMRRRAHGRALQANCDVIGAPGTAPDAMFAIDGRLFRDEQRAALTALKGVGPPPDVLLVNATRRVRGGARGWATQISRFCVLVEDVFGKNRPGVIVVTDDPHTAHRVREQLTKLNDKRPRDIRWRSQEAYRITAICNGIGGDGLLPPGVATVELPAPREFDVEIVDTEASRVIGRLFRIANRIPGGREVAKPVFEAAAYLSRLAAMPCGVSTLVDWLSGSGASDYSRITMSWATFHSALSTFVRMEDCGDDRTKIQECLQHGTILHENYQQATPFALRLANLVGNSAKNKTRQTVIVFTGAIYRRLAQKFLADYTDYPDGAQYEDFSDRVQFILSSELDDRLERIQGAQLVFAGLDDDGLRVLMMDNRIEKRTIILLTQREGQYLRAMLRYLVETFTEFRQLKPRIESILRHLSNLPEDKNIIGHADFVLPTFRMELTFENGGTSSSAEPDAYRIVLENNHELYRRPGHKIYVYDPASEHAERGFRGCEVLSLREGDKLFVMSPDLRELVETVLKEAGVPIENDKSFESALRDYHESIRKRLDERFSGKNLADQVRQLRGAILNANPKLVKKFPADASVRHWVNLGASVDTPFEQLVPQAPMREAHFIAFAQALGFSNLEAAYSWQRVIMPIRNARRYDGRRVSDIYAHMLLEPESAMLHSNIKRQTIKMLFSKARENVVTVEAIIPPENKPHD